MVDPLQGPSIPRRNQGRGVVLTHLGAPISFWNFHALSKPIGSALPAMGQHSEAGAGWVHSHCELSRPERNPSSPWPLPLASQAQWGPRTHPGAQKRRWLPSWSPPLSPPQIPSLLPLISLISIPPLSVPPATAASYLFSLPVMPTPLPSTHTLAASSGKSS